MYMHSGCIRASLSGIVRQRSWMAAMRSRARLRNEESNIPALALVTVAAPSPFVKIVASEQATESWVVKRCAREGIAHGVC